MALIVLTNSLEGTIVDFNISWLRGGHPLLDVGDLSIEASQRLRSLLDQLRYPTVKSLSSAAVIVLINRYAMFNFYEIYFLLHLLLTWY